MLRMAQKHLLEGVYDFKQPALAHLYEWKLFSFEPSKMTENLIIISYPWLTV